LQEFSKRTMSRFGDLMNEDTTSSEPTVVIEPDPIVEEKPIDIGKMSKDELEIYGRTIGVELDRRHSKKALVKELEEELKKQE